jgi:hypothetical protein
MEIPIIFAGVDVGSQHFLNDAVSTFGLSIGLWVIGSRHVQACATQLEEGTPEVTSEAGVAITDNLLRHAVMPEHVVEEEAGNILGGALDNGRRNVYAFGETINKHNQRVEPSGGDGQAGHKVHTDTNPLAIGDRQGL